MGEKGPRASGNNRRACALRPATAQRPNRSTEGAGWLSPGGGTALSLSPAPTIAPATFPVRPALCQPVLFQYSGRAFSSAHARACCCVANQWEPCGNADRPSAIPLSLFNTPPALLLLPRCCPAPGTGEDGVVRPRRSVYFGPPFFFFLFFLGSCLTEWYVPYIHTYLCTHSTIPLVSGPLLCLRSAYANLDTPKRGVGLILATLRRSSLSTTGKRQSSLGLPPLSRNRSGPRQRTTRPGSEQLPGSFLVQRVFFSFYFSISFRFASLWCTVFFPSFASFQFIDSPVKAPRKRG